MIQLLFQKSKVSTLQLQSSLGGASMITKVEEEEIGLMK